MNQRSESVGMITKILFNVVKGLVHHSGGPSSALSAETFSKFFIGKIQTFVSDWSNAVMTILMIQKYSSVCRRSPSSINFSFYSSNGGRGGKGGSKVTNEIMQP